MTNYNAYCTHANIKPRAIVDTVSAEFPKFSKIQFSMCANPAYGVCLLPEAEALLVEAFGEGPGLTDRGVATGKKRAEDNRKKANMFRVRLDDELAARVRELMAELHYSHVQDFLEQALIAILEKGRIEA